MYSKKDVGGCAQLEEQSLLALYRASDTFLHSVIRCRIHKA
jgi:hypothetical protein